MSRKLITKSNNNNNALLCSHHMPVTLKTSSARRRLQYATWVGNTSALIIIVDNDIYLRQSPSDEEDVPLTSTGLPSVVYNGIPDWLYQGKKELLHKMHDIVTSRFVSAPVSCE